MEGHHISLFNCWYFKAMLQVNKVKSWSTKINGTKVLRPVFLSVAETIIDWR